VGQRPNTQEERHKQPWRTRGELFLIARSLHIFRIAIGCNSSSDFLWSHFSVSWWELNHAMMTLNRNVPVFFVKTITVVTVGWAERAITAVIVFSKKNKHK